MALPPPAGPVLASDGSYRMGTLLELTLVTADAAQARRTIRSAFDHVAELEALVSSWDARSELSQLVADAGGPPQRVDPRLRALLELAQVAHARTGGAFDVTVGPLVALWRSAHPAPPEATALAAARARVGIERLRLDGDRIALAAGTQVDLGGLAKGWALDQLSPWLRASDAPPQAWLASFGQSSIHAVGAPPGEEGWRLLLRSPAGGLAGHVRLRDRAVSVSSSLPAGPARAHVIDPRSGRPVARAVAAAVVAPSCAEAEFWSTALLVLGAEAGLARVDARIEDGTEALVIGADGTQRASRGWEAATGYRPLDAHGAGRPLVGALVTPARGLH